MKYKFGVLITSVIVCTAIIFIASMNIEPISNTATPTPLQTPTQTPIPSPTFSITLYRTETGECYHTDDCMYLKSKIPITMEKAINSGLRPCSKCKPPMLMNKY